MNGIEAIGIDIIYHSKILEAKNTWNKFLSSNEIKIAEEFIDEKRKVSYISGIWASKEAIYKASDCAKVSYKNIDIKKNKKGMPEVFINDVKSNFKISISHEEDFSIAVAIKG